MALRGSLEDFSLPDVLQLIGLSRKTGVLRVRRGEAAEGSIWFRDGDIFFAQSDWQRTKLGERLIAAQKITPNALDRVLAIHASDPQGRRIGQILVDESYITGPLLEVFVQEQIQDTVFDLLRWEDGEFSFESLPALLDEDIGLAVSIENISIEASRRMEEWERIKGKVPSMDTVFRMAATSGESGFEVSLKPTEWNVLMLIDGSRNISDLAGATGQTDFEVARIAHGLFSAGLLEVVDDAEATVLRSARLSREALSARAAKPRPQQVVSGPSAEVGVLPAVGETPISEELSHYGQPFPERADEVVTEECLYDRDADAAVSHSVRIAIEPSGAPSGESAARVVSDMSAREIRSDSGVSALETAAEETSVEPATLPAPQPLGPSRRLASPELSELPRPPLAPDCSQEVAEQMSSGPVVTYPGSAGVSIELGLGGAISDEIAALTGAARTARATVVPARSPDSAGTALQFDSRVDRGTLLKIVDAVKNL